MLRYYSYYSIGGYKDLYLGSNEDQAKETFYLPLLPILEEEAKTDSNARRQFDELNELPRIYQLSDKNNYGLPSGAASLFSHAGYKVLYKHVQGSTHALAIRDITCGSKDEMGRSIPFLLVITGDNPDDVRKLDIIATYITSYLKDSEETISSFIGYDRDKNGLRFKLSEFNNWIIRIVRETNSNKVVSSNGVTRVNGSSGNVALLVLPSGIGIQTAIEEQNLFGYDIKSVNMNDIICKSDTERIISKLEETTEELNRVKASYALMKKVAIGAGIAGFLMGLILRSCGRGN